MTENHADMLERIRSLKEEVNKLQPAIEGTLVDIYDQITKDILCIKIERIFKKIEIALRKYDLISEADDVKNIFKENEDDLLFQIAEPYLHEGELLVLQRLTDLLNIILSVYGIDNISKQPNFTESDNKFKHSEDFTWIKVRGHEYTPPPQQAAIIKYMFEQLENGIPELSGQEILTAVDSTSKYMNDAFQIGSLWKNVVVSTKKGMYKLNID